MESWSMVSESNHHNYFKSFCCAHPFFRKDNALWTKSSGYHTR